MKTWKPASTPSNRDRLELYALHKQAVSGDAPPLVLSSPTPGERAKYNAWKQKSGMAPSQAMRLYLEESDRQVRVYGTTTTLTSSNEDHHRNPQTLTPENTPQDGIHNSNHNSNHHHISMQQRQQQPRGLAAIPLLCAAASESRQAYLRRLANTRLEQAWWNRQEPLCATPGSFWALPEQLVLSIASGLEYISLVVVVMGPSNNSNNDTHSHHPTSPSPLFSLLPPPPVLQSFFWPAHNALLAVWMGVILVATTWTAAMQLLATLVWGSRRTGHSLFALWNDTVLLASQSIHALTERHQPLTARLTGLLLLPFTVLVALTNSIGGMSSNSNSSPSSPAAITTSLLYCLGLGMTWWYWFLTLPWLAVCFLSCAVLAGGCFALIELAGV
jgi:acyl-CoA-binding protein